MEIIKRVMLTLGISIYSMARLAAQPNPPPTGAGGSIDAGAIVLLAGVAIYGYKQIKKYQSIAVVRCKTAGK